MTLNQITKVKGPGIHTQANIVSNTISLGGIATASNFKTGTSNLHSAGVEVAGVNVLGADTPIGLGATIYNSGNAIYAGVVTATKFVGQADISGGSIVGTSATFTGNVSIGGTLTYEDVTNIDSVGLITARSGIDCNGTLEVSSTSNFDGTLKIAEKIEHLGDDDTWFGFPVPNAFQLKAGNATRFYVSDTTAVWNRKDVSAGVGTCTMLLNNNDAAGTGVALAFGPSTNYNTRHSSIEVVQDGNNNMSMGFKVTDATQSEHAIERLRITSGGNLNIGGNFSETSHPLNVSHSTKPSFALHTGTTIRADFSATTGITSIRSYSNSPFTINIGGSGETEAFRIDGYARVLIGTNAYKSNLNSSADAGGQIAQFVGKADNTNHCVGIFAYSGTSNPTARGAKLQLNRARSTDGTTNTAVAVDDLIGSIEFKGNDATSFTTSARIDSSVDSGTVGTDRIPGNLRFYTSADNTAVPQERLRIKSGGTVAIPAQGASNANPRLLFESAVDDNDFSFSQYEDGNGTYTLIGQNIQLNGSGNVEVLDSAHKTAGIHVDARNHGALWFLTGVANETKERLRINNVGDVGIGTDNPTGVNAVSGNDAVLAVGILTASQIYGPITGALTPTGDVTINDNLTVNGNTTLGDASTDTITVKGNLNINNSYIDFSGSLASTPATAAAIFRPADNTLAFSTANVEKLRITSGGDVGIGTINPTGADALTSNTTTLAVGTVKSTNVNAANITVNGSTLSSVIVGTTVNNASSAGKATNLAGGSTNFPQLVLQTATDTTDWLERSATGGQILATNSASDGFEWVQQSGISEVTVTQHKNSSQDSRSCTSPIYVNDNYKIGIGSTSNAYGNKWEQDTDPTTVGGGSNTVCDGDIWYDTSTSGGMGGVAVPIVVTSNTASSAGQFVVVNDTSLTVTLPASPDVADYVDVRVLGTRYCTVARNGSKIESLEEDLYIDIIDGYVKLIYTDATRGWIISS